MQDGHHPTHIHLLQAGQWLDQNGKTLLVQTGKQLKAAEMG